MALHTKPRDVVVSGTGDDADRRELAAVIPVGEFQEARQEPEWLAFRKAALAERQKLRAQGRSS
jgi:hypothetical protein